MSLNKLKRSLKEKYRKMLEEELRSHFEENLKAEKIFELYGQKGIFAIAKECATHLKLS